MTVLPLMLNSSSPRGPAGLTRPSPWVAIQFMFTPGPACSTRPLPVGISHRWLSMPKLRLGSVDSIASMGTPGRRFQPVASVQTSPCLLPTPPAQEPPSVSTEPSASVVLPW